MYIDPGNANVIVQVVIAGVAGAGLAIATFWRRIVNFFKRNKNGDTKDTAQATAATPEAAAAPASSDAAIDSTDGPASDRATDRE